jgi:hypothetical protein
MIDSLRSALGSAKREWREYTAAKPLSGKIRDEEAKS